MGPKAKISLRPRRRLRRKEGGGCYSRKGSLIGSRLLRDAMTCHCLSARQARTRGRLLVGMVSVLGRQTRSGFGWQPFRFSVCRRPGGELTSACQAMLLAFDGLCSNSAGGTRAGHNRRKLGYCVDASLSRRALFAEME
ncbi:hypothetical protein BT67DRAFT_201231 [Trichocladium antarcticum]|uniref:Uncharacterized protein n=1 Tax=Trichocladium antarcticum TaxID=1450529 RepID=A0AAN6ZGV4_9PEZI|nr:hypothetical protein BT67DRAFT_201231 [Trichocladium antarcticum]